MKSQAANSDPVTAGVQEVKDDLTAGIAEYLGVGPSMANRREYLIFLARFPPGFSGNSLPVGVHLSVAAVATLLCDHFR